MKGFRQGRLLNIKYGGYMSKITKHGNPTLSWILRILLIIMILFFALFSLDVFEEGRKFWDMILGFLIHNIPSFVMIIILIIAWKRENIGGILLMLGILGFGIFLIFRMENFMWGTIIMLGIPFLIGAMFVINYYLLGKMKSD
jgi:hypothetical protein